MFDRVVAFVLAGLLLFASGTASQARETWFDTTPAEQKAFDALDSLTEVEFIDVPMSAALGELGSKYGVRTRISAETRRKLSALHRERAIVNRTLSGVTLRTTLRVLLHDLGLDHYVDREGEIVITTVEEKLTRIVTRRYDVSRLVRPDASAEMLASVLRRLAAERPQSAKPRIGGFGETLVVRANDAGHDEVDHLLTLINEALNREQQGKVRVSQTEKILASLNEDSELSVRNKPLSDVIKQLAAAHDLNIVLDQRALDKVGVSAERPIPSTSTGFQLHEIPLTSTRVNRHETFTAVLEPLNGGYVTVLDQRATEKAGISAKHPISLTSTGVKLHETLDVLLTPLNLGYVIEDEVLKITTRERAAATALVRAVDVGGLLGENGSADELRKAVVDTTTEPLNEVVVFRDALIVSGKPAAHVQVGEALRMLGGEAESVR